MTIISKKTLAFSLILLATFVANCSKSDSTDTAVSESKLSFLSITGDGPSGNIRTGLKIQGDHFDQKVVVSLLTKAGEKIADLAITSVSAQEISVKLPENTSPGDYLVRLTRNRAEVSAPVTLLQGEVGPQGPAGPPGTNGIGIKGDKGDPSLGSLHAIDANGGDLGFALDVSGSTAKVWLTALSVPHQIDLTTGDVIDAAQEVKMYFSTADCTGTPHTYQPLTVPNTIYKSAVNTYVRTTTTAVNLFIPSVYHVGNTTCSAENASYELWEAQYVAPPLPSYPAPLTIEPR